MLILAMLTVTVAATLAFANGGNDVSKGVATLAGCGRATYRRAIAWGTLWTAAGAAAALVIGAGLVKAFTSSLVEPHVLASPVFALAVAAGAAGWVMFATRTGLPVSTTHALAGALVGVAFAIGGPGSIRWEPLLVWIAAPLALGPLVSGVIGYGVQATSARWSRACVCVEDAMVVARLPSAGSAVALYVPRVTASSTGCDDGSAAVRRVLSANSLHWAAAAALSFARGVNDTPKIAAIAALGLAGLTVDLSLAFVVTGVAMVAGSYLAGRRVTETLGKRVVDMDRDSGLASALVAAGLVMAASFFILPVSTTHVSTGAIVGAGVRQGEAAVKWQSVRALVLAWIVTLPVAAALGALGVIAAVRVL
ncbi:MAG: inorganic phosphate transporter [Vicinamibacterales bacterium]